MNNKKYTPKETLALILTATNNVSLKEFNKLVSYLEEELSKNKSKSEILENIKLELLMQIENYWELKESQVIAYGYLVFNHFKISCEAITEENITKNFIYQMRFYSPDNAVEFVERNFNVRLDSNNNE